MTFELFPNTREYTVSRPGRLAVRVMWPCLKLNAELAQTLKALNVKNVNLYIGKSGGKTSMRIEPVIIARNAVETVSYSVCFDCRRIKGSDKRPVVAATISSRAFIRALNLKLDQREARAVVILSKVGDEQGQGQGQGQEQLIYEGEVQLRPDGANAKPYKRKKVERESAGVGFEPHVAARLAKVGLDFPPPRL